MKTSYGTVKTTLEDQEIKLENKEEQLNQLKGNTGSEEKRN